MKFTEVDKYMGDIQENMDKHYLRGEDRVIPHEVYVIVKRFTADSMKLLTPIQIRNSIKDECRAEFS